jgi:hypothetical protein
MLLVIDPFDSSVLYSTILMWVEFWFVYASNTSGSSNSKFGLPTAVTVQFVTDHMKKQPYTNSSPSSKIEVC